MSNTLTNRVDSKKMFKKIAVIGLGYVGLPLALELGKYFNTVGYDINQRRIDELQQHIDSTGECEKQEILNSTNCSFSANLDDTRDAELYIVTVPTPIDGAKKPNLSMLIAASKAVATVLSADNYVVYESTVYPGATREVCIPILEKISGLELNNNLFVGYSPERINPGRNSQKLTEITKVTSGSSPEAAEKIDKLYSHIIKAGTYQASSIEVAEAAKVIENTQRDVNIGLVNELALIFEKMGIETHEVLEAAGTKWNFLKFEPGLVGGHCIGVDPYYLTHKSELCGYSPEIILAGRRVNEKMAKWSAQSLIKRMIKENININGARVLVAGITFKEDCPDIRNSKVFDLIDELLSFGCNIDCYDPVVDPIDLPHSIQLKTIISSETYDAVVFAVRHTEIICEAQRIVMNNLNPSSVVQDLKSILPSAMTDLRL